MADRNFVYTSTCCNAPAKKPPCAMEKGQHVKNYLGAKPEGASSLGAWRCTACRRNCSVTRTVKQAKQEKPEAAVAYPGVSLPCLGASDSGDSSPQFWLSSPDERRDAEVLG